MKRFLLLPLLCTLAAAQVTIGGSNFPFINSGPAPNGQVGVPYTWSLQAVGGVQPYTWTVTGGTTLPGGLSLNGTTGIVSGTPTTAAVTNVQIQVTDAVGNFTSQPFSINILNVCQINAGAFPNGTVSVAYTSSPSPTTAGCTAPLTWSLSSGSLPTGLTQSTSTGVVSGTPTVANTYSFTIKVVDVNGLSATQPQTVTIAGSAPTCGPTTNYACSAFCTTTSCPMIQPPTPPFSGATGKNQIACDPSINGPCSTTAGIDPIVRATDSSLSSSSFTVCPNGGACDPLSTDDTILMVILAGTGTSAALDFNPTTMQIANSSIATVPNTAQYVWDTVAPKTLWSLTTNTPTVYKTVFTSSSVYTQTSQFVVQTACSTLIPSGTYTGGSITIDASSNYIYGALLTAGQNSPGYVFRYNLTTHACTALYTGATTNNLLLENGTISSATLPNSCTSIGLHNSTTYLNGTWSRITTGTIGTCTNVPMYWNINTTTLWTCTTNPSGHNDNGYNVETIGNPPNNFRYADVTAGQTTYCANINSQHYGQWPYTFTGGDVENHFTFVDDTLDSKPGIGGIQYVNNPSTTLPTGCNGCNEIYSIIRPPATYKWVRHAHTFSSGSTLCPGCDFRTQNNIVGGDLNFGVFSSDMLLGMGTDAKGNPRQDVFIVRRD